MLVSANLFSPLPAADTAELFDELLTRPGLRLERIVSCGQTTPEGEWYDQEGDEWVLLLAGAAELLIEGEEGPRRLIPGDYLLLPARCRHRVTWTDPDQQTVWLALHLANNLSTSNHG
jgi:cupin 2 domain-containing protein